MAWCAFAVLLGRTIISAVIGRAAILAANYLCYTFFCHFQCQQQCQPERRFLDARIVVGCCDLDIVEGNQESIKEPDRGFDGMGLVRGTREKCEQARNNKYERKSFLSWH
jgi:hypothetical protein